MLFDGAVHEAAHGVVALVLGFAVTEVRVWNDDHGVAHGSTLLDLGQRSAGASGDLSSRPKGDDLARGLLLHLENGATDADRDVLARSFGSVLPPRRVPDYLCMSIAGRLAQGRVIAEGRALSGAVDDIACEGLLIDLLLPAAERRNARWLAQRQAEFHVGRHWDSIRRCALELVLRVRLDGAEIARIAREQEPEHAA